MKATIYNLISFTKWVMYSCIRLISICFILSYNISDLLSQEIIVSDDSGSDNPQTFQIIYRNPRVYNVDYTFELCPDKDSIDPSKDLKLWIPMAREWDSQKAVKIIFIDPEPQSTYTDPEYGNKILFWDFGKEPVKDMYVVKIRYRAEVFEVYSDVDLAKVEPYDTKSDEYHFYTRSNYTTNINPEIKEIANSVVGDEKNPYLKAKLIFDYVVMNMNFADIRRERGSSVESILEDAVTDPETGEVHYEGQCDHYSILFVALCRAAGISARGVTGMVGWGPWIREKDLILRDMRYTLLTSEGLASTRLFGPFGGHIWSEFYLPGYGWIPADPTWNQFGYQSNIKLILSKGRDVLIGPNATKMDDGVYGDQWIPLHNGRANAIGWGVWNISRIRVANAKTLHTSDPFPADAYAEYATNLYPDADKEDKSKDMRKGLIRKFYNNAIRLPASGNIFEADKRLIANREAYLCQVLHDITGEEKFKKIFENYLDLRLVTGKPVSTEKFREIAEEVYGAPLDFFFDEWVDKTSLPKLMLENVKAEKRAKDWIIQGSLVQDGEIFIIPVELVLETESGKEIKKILLGSSTSKFEFITFKKPLKLTVDPDFHIPMIRWMPPRLGMLWDSYPNLTVIYGTLKEAEANKTAAERFVKEFAGLGQEVIKADTSVIEDDLRKSIIIFGRPETNKIAQRFSNNFPVKFEKDMFIWKGTAYNQPAQGVAQIIENPLNNSCTMNLYAGLSGDATLKVCDKSEWQEELDGWLLFDFDSSYIIYDDHKKLVSGDWEDADSDLVWNFIDMFDK